MRPLRITLIVGTRPQFAKLSPVMPLQHTRGNLSAFGDGGAAYKIIKTLYGEVKR